MPAPGLCGVRDVRIERPDGRNHTGRGCRGGGGRKHIELAGDPEGREINMARRPVAGAARLGSVRLFVDVTGRYWTLEGYCSARRLDRAAGGAGPTGTWTAGAKTARFGEPSSCRILKPPNGGRILIIVESATTAAPWTMTPAADRASRA